MNAKTLLAAALTAGLGLGLIAGTIAIADSPDKPSKPEFKLPPGWTEADMKACELAGTAGKMHEQLAKDVGVWQGKSTLWMFPDSEPAQTECTNTISKLMDGRFIKTEWAGEMPGMGPYNGLGTAGFDNVSQKFVSTWIDNHSTGIMYGTGELSADGKTLTWNYTVNCPIQKKPVAMREVVTAIAPGKKKIEMFGADPKSGKEFKMMAVELTKK